MVSGKSTGAVARPVETYHGATARAAKPTTTLLRSKKDERAEMILGMVRAYYARRGVAPTVADVVATLRARQRCSNADAHKTIGYLEGEGKLRRYVDPGRGQVLDPSARERVSILRASAAVGDDASTDLEMPAESFEEVG